MAVITLIAGGLTSSSPSAGAAASACQPSGARTLRHNGQARVYRRHGSIYACLYATARSQRIGWVFVPRMVLVRKHDGCGSAVLEDDPAIERGSMRLPGRTLSWRSGGVTRTASLC
jgi:hypothetical protein